MMRAPLRKLWKPPLRDPSGHSYPSGSKGGARASDRFSRVSLMILMDYSAMNAKQLHDIFLRLERLQADVTRLLGQKLPDRYIPSRRRLGTFVVAMTG